MTAGPWAGAVDVHLRAPLTPADVQALCDRVRAEAADPAAVVVVVVLSGPAEVAVVDALARVALTARREGLAVRVRCDGGPIRPLLQLCGLDDVLPPARTEEPATRAASALHHPEPEENP